MTFLVGINVLSELMSLNPVISDSGFYILSGTVEHQARCRSRHYAVSTGVINLADAFKGIRHYRPGPNIRRLPARELDCS